MSSSGARRRTLMIAGQPKDALLDEAFINREVQDKVVVT
jgi:hypothetical protein